MSKDYDFRLIVTKVHNLDVIILLDSKGKSTTLPGLLVKPTLDLIQFAYPASTPQITVPVPARSRELANFDGDDTRLQYTMSSAMIEILSLMAGEHEAWTAKYVAELFSRDDKTTSVQVSNLYKNKMLALVEVTATRSHKYLVSPAGHAWLKEHGVVTPDPSNQPVRQEPNKDHH